MPTNEIETNLTFNFNPTIFSPEMKDYLCVGDTCTFSLDLKYQMRNRSSIEFDCWLLSEYWRVETVKIELWRVATGTILTFLTPKTVKIELPLKNLPHKLVIRSY